MSSRTVNRATQDDSATARMLAARQSRDRLLHERTLLVAVLSHVYPSHVATVDRDGQGADWRLVVCMHSPAGQLSWRITNDDAETLFAHLERKQCKYDGHGYDLKIVRLYDLAVSVPS